MLKECIKLAELWHQSIPEEVSSIIFIFMKSLVLKLLCSMTSLLHVRASIKMNLKVLLN